MAHYAEDDFYQQEPEEPYDNQMEERLVQALGHHVKDSVNQVLIKALKPFTQPLVHYGQRELMSGPSHARVPDSMTADMSRTLKGSGGPKSSAEILYQMASSDLRDHEYEQDIYEIPRELHSQDVLGQDDSQSFAAHTSDSDRTRDEPKMSVRGGGGRTGAAGEECGRATPRESQRQEDPSASTAVNRWRQPRRGRKTHKT
ncbi:hypothetical protein NDU88_005953 [Pleurodeles waltl]|uniref:Uncharacterized protein n=1 Tax=Pleurodeles waltl TaxID=8319 RepID=A0AAV7LP81_PLEWA|nr:hypothetical protein NDU88_005953 [Pleurodeles waltl]